MKNLLYWVLVPITLVLLVITMALAVASTPFLIAEVIVRYIVFECRVKFGSALPPTDSVLPLYWLELGQYVVHILLDIPTTYMYNLTKNN